MDDSWGEIPYAHASALRHKSDKHQRKKAVVEGGLCTSQAVSKQIGIVGVSLTCVLEPIMSWTRAD